MGKEKKRSLMWYVVALWICLPGLFFYWMELGTRHEEKRLAQGSAKAFFQLLVLTRQWNASHGGIYVPITATIQPNPYLPVEGRDLLADNGLHLTKINPAYMTRQIAEKAKERHGGIQFHLTSLKPINPANAPTPWEAKWLKTFEQGAKEQGDFFEDGDTVWFRYMAPLWVDSECLTCHARHGYKKGDIRGGLSVSLPFPPHAHLRLFIGYVAVEAVGLFFILLGFRFYDQKRRLFDATFNSPVPSCVTDKNYTILMGNDAYWAEFGALPPGQKTIKCFAHRPGESCHTENCPLTRILAGSSQYSYEVIKKKGGIPRHFIVIAKPRLDHKGRLVGTVESFQDITMRKQAEEALAESNHKLEALSNTDGLTGIANRRHFDQVLAQEYARHGRSGATLSLIMLDIDHFKSFNDIYGHVRGDECLQQVAQVVVECVDRAADLAARYGGEEFACILPETDRKGAIAVAEKIRRRLMECAIPHQGSPVAECVTASLGVVTMQCAADETAVDLLATVDKLLYRAKSAGRNRVETLAPHEIEEEIKGHLVWLVWRDTFCCGNDRIDSQHQSLFRLSNLLLDAVLSGRQPTDVSEIITKLLDEVRMHFQEEEAILEAAGAPGLDRHIAEHTALLDKGAALLANFQAATLGVGDLFQFLAYDMVVRHMVEIDREFFPFLHKAHEGAEQNGKERGTALP